VKPDGSTQTKPREENHDMFPIHKPILLLHLGGTDIRTTAEHPFYVIGRGCAAPDLRRLVECAVHRDYRGHDREYL
jgi:hypothetical protein